MRSADNRVGFIVGCSRSGTTWLYRLLLGCRGVTGVGEARWGELLRSQGGAALDTQLGRLATRTRAALVIDKTPANVFDLDLLSSRFPHARAILMVRDPRAVAASMRSATHWAKARDGFDLVTAARLWCQAMREAARARQWMGNRLLEIRYEQLACNPVSWLRIAATHFDLCAGVSELVRCVAANDFAHFTARGQSGANRFFRIGQSDSWHHVLTAEEIRLVEQTVGARLQEWGYSRHTS